jgi:putative transposase
MSDKNPNFYQRRSIRLKGYDYSKTGLYFITICTQNRECIFGEMRVIGADLCVCPNQNISQKEMVLNNAGKMIGKWYAELENKYPDIRCHEMIVMPNHFHCIIEKTCECENDHQDYKHQYQDAHVGAPLRGRPNDKNDNQTKYGPDNQKYHATISDIVDWFKTMTTNEYIHGVKNQGWKRFDGKLWQRNYWEHIIRVQDSYDRIAEYIEANPSKWDEDQLNPYQKIY